MRMKESFDCLRRQGKFWIAGAVGMGVGVLGGAAYLLFGGEYIVNIPYWAAIVFYTGFAAGNQAVNLGVEVSAAKVLGVVTVGLTYALVAVLVCFVWLGIKNLFFARKQK